MFDVTHVPRNGVQHGCVSMHTVCHELCVQYSGTCVCWCVQDKDNSETVDTEEVCAFAKKLITLAFRTAKNVLPTIAKAINICTVIIPGCKFEPTTLEPSHP